MKLESQKSRSPIRQSPESDPSDDDDSTTGSLTTEFVGYRDRPEWADIEPKSIKTQTSILNIRYSPRYEEAFSYFRAIMERDELSERALELTADCIDLQKSNFTVWFYRRKILKKLKHHLENELKFVEGVIETDPKNYQVWHHRKTIVEWLKDGSSDKSLTASVLTIDTKNYHAWQHRQWVINEFGLWADEIEFTDSHIASDVTNNSAWNHRFYVVKETRLYEDQKWLSKEISMVHAKIELNRNNESSWSYLRGLLLLAFGGLTKHDATQDLCKKLFDKKNCRALHLLSFMLDSIHEKLSENKTSFSEQKISKYRAKASEICKILTEVDSVRSRYWKYCALKIEDIFI